MYTREFGDGFPFRNKLETMSCHFIAWSDNNTELEPQIRTMESEIFTILILGIFL